MFEQKELSLTATGLASAVIGSVLLGVLSILGLIGVGEPIIINLATLFVGYGIGFSGLFVGMVWGFFVGSVVGLLFAWFYNKLLK